MTRLPTVGGDGDVWGTVLNDYLTQTGVATALATSPSAGATSFDIASLPHGLSVGDLIAIDAYTTQCEVRPIVGLSGNTVTVAATKFDHTSGDAAIVIRENAPIQLYGIKGDGTDEWSPIQRMVREVGAYNIRVVGTWGMPIYIGQPLIFETGSRASNLFITSRTGFSPVDSTGAMCILANGGGTRSAPFTASAADNSFTIAADPGHGVSNTIVFNAPYGETMPGGVVPGRIYYIKSEIGPTQFTISETDGGADLDITSDGAGYYYTRISSLSRVYWDHVYLSVSIADLNGLWTCLQQPAYTNNLRIEMDAAATTRAIDTSIGNGVGWILTGQNSYHLNVEINTHINCVGVYMQGSGHVIRAFNDNGVLNNDIGLKIIGQWHHIEDMWIESVGSGVWFPSGATIRNIVLDGAHYAGGDPFILCDMASASFELGGCYSLTTAAVLSGSGAPTLIDEGITSNYFAGLWHPATGIVIFKARQPIRINTDWTLKKFYNLVRVDTSSADKTITLPTAEISYWYDWQTTIVNGAGANNVILAPDSGTINGAATYSIGPGEKVILFCTGQEYQAL